jgi:homoserine kinase type II
MLLPYIPDGWLGFDDASLFSLGKVQAELHATPPPDSLGRDFVVGFTLFNRLFKLADEKNIWSPFLHRLRTEAIILDQEIPKNLPTGVIHGDLFPDNVLGSNGEVTAILDFEECCVEVLVLDIAMSLVGFGWQDGCPVESRWLAIISGYESVRILTDEEWVALPILHRYATLSVAAWRYWQFVINIPNTEHTNRYVEMVERIDVELPRFLLDRRL